MSVTLAPRTAPARRVPSAPPRKLLLKATSLCVRYPKCTECSLDGVDLEIREGERIALIGPSGGGKTTLLRALEGSIAPHAGEVTRNGQAALIYQDLRLVNEQTVLANICSGAFGEIGRFSGVFSFPENVSRRATELLHDLGLGRLADRRVGSLSGGQRQRTAIARALCARPRVLLADEPLASLDLNNARRTLELLACLQKKYNFALAVSTHHPGLLPGFFTRYLLVNEGRVLPAPPGSVAGERQSRPVEICVPQFAAEEGSEPAPEQDRELGGESKARRRARRLAVAAVVMLVFAWSITSLELRGSSFGGAASAIIQFVAGTIPASWRDFLDLPWARLAGSLVQTIQMAVVGTAIGIAVSLPLAVLASRQTGPRFVRGPVRLLLNAIRTVPSIYWALVFVAFVGLGPVAGVFALGAYSVGYLTKFFYEALEDADNRPASALRSLGASRLQSFCWAVWPAARPAVIGACLFVLEYNVRGASVLGVVGAGGIGQDLMYYIEWRQFPSAAAGLLMILVVVIALDALSQRWRRHLTRQRGE